MPERWHRNSPPGLVFGLLLVLLGVVFFLSVQGFVSWGDWWKYFIIGLGAILVLDVLVRYVLGARRGAMFGRFITGLILASVGVVFLFGLGKWWPLILIAAGLAILLGALFRRR